VRPFIVTGRYRPHELLLLVVSVVTGVAYLLGSPPPTSVAALLPHWQTYTWAAGLLASGVMGIFGCAWRRDLELGLQAERAAMLIGGGALLLYTVSVFALGGRRALLAGGITAAWTAANLWRAWQIGRDLREIGP
jgi:hypothetical protein